MQCADCLQENPDHARFCNACGKRFDAVAQSGERRQLTVLFADLVDATAHASRLDPEDWSSAVQRYQQTCSHCVDEYGGHIAQFLGDGVLVYFG